MVGQFTSEKIIEKNFLRFKVMYAIKPKASVRAPFVSVEG